MDRVRNQVQKHLLQLNSITANPRYPLIHLYLDQYPMPIEITTCQGKDIPEEFFDIERSSLPAAFFEARPNAFNYGTGPKAVVDDTV
jgi:hypothetical protein